MTEYVRITKCTCDICKKAYEIKPNDKSPLFELVLPMDYYNEYGGYEHMTTAKVEVCEDCLNDIYQTILEHYSMKLLMYGGLEIKKK